MASARNEPNKAAIYATALTALFAIAGIAIVDPILPVIGLSMGATTWQIELLFTAYIAVMAIGMIPAVMSTGKFGYKKVLAVGVSGVAVAAIAASFTNSIGSLAAFRGLWGLGNALFFATAMVLLVSLANDREWVVGLFETCVGLGFAVGPLIGGLLGKISWRVPFFACGVFMIGALVIALTRLKDPEQAPAPLRLGQVFTPFKKPAFVLLAVLTATYNFVYFIVLGYTPVALGLEVVPLGLVFTAWGLGLAFGILVIGHRLAHRFGGVQSVGFSVIVVMLTLIGIAEFDPTWAKIVTLIVAGVAMGVANANLTDLALAMGSPDRRITTGAFNLVRWGFAAPAPVLAGLLAEHVGINAPFWIGVAVIAVGVVVFFAGGHYMARSIGERVLWSRWNADAKAAEGTPEEALELV
jgi:MFS transporter, ACDE family, multidrug resistance protein